MVRTGERDGGDTVLPERHVVGVVMAVMVVADDGVVGVVHGVLHARR